MTFDKTAFAGAVLALAMVAGTGGAHAAVMSYSDFVTTTDNAGAFPTPVVTVDDENEAGFLTFSIGSTGVSGNLSGVGFQTGGIFFDETDIVDESVAILGFGSPDNNVGGGVNTNGSYNNGQNSPSFDFLFRIAQTDVSGTPLTFQVATSILTLDDLGDVFLRFQTVSGDMVTQSSAKIIGEPGDTPVVPLPASALLLLGGLGGLGSLRGLRRKFTA